MRWKARGSLSSMHLATTPSTHTVSSGTEVASLKTRSESTHSDLSGHNDSHINPRQWQEVSRTLGIATTTICTQSNADVARIARKVEKRRALDTKQTVEYLVPLIASAATRSRRLAMTTSAAFDRDMIPTVVPSLDSNVPRRTGLLPPRPALAAGYHSQTFSTHQRELQNGIISDLDGGPQDLGRLAKPITDLYWPFLVVEISEKSLRLACESCVDATATINANLITFASSLLSPDSAPNPSHDNHLLNTINSSAASFSLAVYNKSACILTHYSNGFSSGTVGILDSYNLESVHSLNSLYSRLQSIFTWAENARLPAINDLLERFDARVNFSQAVHNQETYGPMDVVNSVGMIMHPIEQEKGAPPRKGLFKAVIAETMPKWSKVEM